MEFLQLANSWIFNIESSVNTGSAMIKNIFSTISIVFILINDSYEKTTSTTRPSDSKACKDGGTYFNHTDKCYKFHTDTRDFEDALKVCKVAGGTLASILDAETNEFITTLTKQYSWIGGKRTAKGKSEWLWTDGSGWKYDNWSCDNPDDSQGKQDCVAINWAKLGKWDDGFCKASYPFVCQY